MSAFRRLSDARDVRPSRAFLLTLLCIFVLAGVAGSVLYGNQINENALDERLASHSLLTPNLCLSFERFDADEGACTAKCSDEKCAKLESNYRRIMNVLSLDDLKLYFGFVEAPYDETSTAAERADQPIDPDSVMNRTFQVEHGELGKEVSHTGQPYFGRTPQELWNMFEVAIAPQDRLSVDEFLILNDVNASLPSQAWVLKIGTTTWQAALNAGVSFTRQGHIVDRGNFVHTLIHESAHLMTLNDRQLDASISSTTCTTIMFDEGCARPASYIHAFVRQFWHSSIGAHEMPFGEYKKGDFVSGYAAENMAEDISESWAAYVLLPKPRGNSIAEQKTLFFYNYPELVERRNAIRHDIGTIR